MSLLPPYMRGATGLLFSWRTLEPSYHSGPVSQYPRPRYSHPPPLGWLTLNSVFLAMPNREPNWFAIGAWTWERGPDILRKETGPKVPQVWHQTKSGFWSWNQDKVILSDFTWHELANWYANKERLVSFICMSSLRAGSPARAGCTYRQ
jgi:hypothetical protein